MIVFKCSFIPILFGNFDVTISATSRQCRNYRRPAEGVYTFVHGLYRVRIPDRHCVQHTVAEAKAKTSVLIKDEENRGGPLQFHG